MDEFFGKIKGGATKAMDSAEKIAREVAKRTSNAITHTKLAFSANEANSKVKDIYAEMGKELYAKHLNGEETDEVFTASFEQIDKLMDEIEMINAKIAELKNSVKCPECGAFNAPESEYCSKCGSQLADAEEVTEEDIDEALNEAEADAAEEDEEDVIVINPKKPEAAEEE